MIGRAVCILLAAVLLTPLGAIGLLSLSPTSGMDLFQQCRPSLRWWILLFTDQSWLAAIGTSLLVATASSLLSLLLALPVAMLGRLSGSRLAQRTLVVGGLSYCVPPIVLAVGLYQLVIRLGLFDSVAGLALAHMAFTLPVASFVLAARFRITPTSYYLVARGLGARPAFAAVTWLLATQRSTLAACFGAGVLTSISEVIVTLYLTDTKVVTMAKRAVSGIARDVEPTGFAAMVAWMAFVVVVVVLVFPSLGRWGRQDE